MPDRYRKLNAVHVYLQIKITVLHQHIVYTLFYKDIRTQETQYLKQLNFHDYSERPKKKLAQRHEL